MPIKESPEETILPSATTDELQKIAVFDFDGTILEGQSPVMLVQSLLARRLMPLSTILSIAWWGVRYKLRLPHEQSEVRKRIFSLFTDNTADETNVMIDRLYECEIALHLREDALVALAKYKQANIPVILASASFEPIVKKAAEQLAVFGQVSTKMEVVDGRYTGGVQGDPVEGEEKSRAVVRFADERFGVGRWEIVAAYGDHHSDEPLLSLAKEAFAVTPDSGLRKTAIARGWKIVDWR